MSKKVPDMGKVRGALDRIEKVLREHPEVAERTKNFFEGELPGGETDMPKRKKGDVMGQTFLRLPTAWLHELDELLPRLERASVAGVSVTASDVLRAVVREGIDALDSKLPKAGKVKRKK